MKVDDEIDIHGETTVQARTRLDRVWAERKWQGLRRVRVIHGTGAVLYAFVREWCEEKGIPWTLEWHNPGTTILHPGRRIHTPPPPPHRPLAQSLKSRPTTTDQRPSKKPEARRPTTDDRTPNTERPTPDTRHPTPDPMAEEFARLADEDPRISRRKKHQ